MKRFILVLLMAFALPAWAGLSSNDVGSAGWSNLSEEQKAAVLQQVAQAAAKNKGIGSPASAEKVGQWVDIGERIGKMIGGVAKEVGVAVNEFVKTPVGKMAMLIIVWNYMGSVLVHLFGAVGIFICGMSFILYMMRRSCQVVRTYNPDKTDIFGRSRLVRTERERLSGDEKAAFSLGAAAILAVSIIAAFSF